MKLREMVHAKVKAPWFCSADQPWGPMAMFAPGWWTHAGVVMMEGPRKKTETNPRTSRGIRGEGEKNYAMVIFKTNGRLWRVTWWGDTIQRHNAFVPISG